MKALRYSKKRSSLDPMPHFLSSRHGCWCAGAASTAASCQVAMSRAASFCWPVPAHLLHSARKTTKPQRHILTVNPGAADGGARDNWVQPDATTQDNPGGRAGRQHTLKRLSAADAGSYARIASAEPTTPEHPSPVAYLPSKPTPRAQAALLCHPHTAAPVSCKPEPTQACKGTQAAPTYACYGCYCTYLRSV
jgi:hypothetical protein